MGSLYKKNECVTVLSKYEFRRLLGEGWKRKVHKILDFSGPHFRLNTIRGEGDGLLSKYLNTNEIEIIDLSNNDLVSVENVFSLKDSLKFHSLLELNLCGNKIVEFETPLYLPYLYKLNLSTNNLYSLPDLSFLEQLMFLDLSYNNIQVTKTGADAWSELRMCKKLKKLNLSYNNLNISPSTLAELVLMFKDTLRDFSIIGNPFCENFPEYQCMVISCIPKLKFFNGRELTSLQKMNNSNFDLRLLDSYDDVFDLRTGSAYNATKILEIGNISGTNYGRLDYLIELLEYLVEEGPTIQLCANFLQGCERIYNETMKPWTTDYGGDLGDADVFESRRFIQIFGPNSRSTNDRIRDTERFIELAALAIDRQEEDIISGTNFCRIWLLTALIRLIHIPVGGLGVGISRLLGNLMDKKDIQSEVSYIIGTLVLPSLKGRLFSDPIVQTVLACISILPHSKLLAMALSDHLNMILEYTSSHVRTEFHKPLMSILALSSLYRDNAIVLSGYGVPSDLAGTLITLYLYSTPANVNKGGINEMGNQGQSLAFLKPKEEFFIHWSSADYILSDQTLDYVTRNISASEKLGKGDSFSIYKIAKLLAKKRFKNQNIYKKKEKETLNLSILPDFVKFTNLQQTLILHYLQIISNCCLASERASTLCVELGFHSNFLMPILSEFLSCGSTSKFDDVTSRMCSEIINTIKSFIESSKIALLQMIVNFHLIDWLLIPIKETPFGDPDVVYSCMSAILSICNRNELIESLQYTGIIETSSLIGKAFNIYTNNAPIGNQFKFNLNGESFQVLNYIIQQLDFLNPQLEFLNGNQYFREMVSFYSSNIEGSSNIFTSNILDLIKNANSLKVQKSIQAILDMVVFLFENKSIGICSKVIEEIYKKGYCILFMRLLEIPGESVPISAIHILSMIDISEMDTISINEFLRLIKIESLKKEKNDKEKTQDEGLLNDEDAMDFQNEIKFSILGPLWLHLLTYIRKLISNKGSTNWYIFRDTFAKDICFIVFSGLKYSWNQFILNSPFSLVVNHLSNVNEAQIHDVFTILFSSRVIRALSCHKGFREHMRTAEVQRLFEFSLKKEEKHFAAFDPDTAIEISWCGRSVSWLLATFKGQNRLSSTKKVAARILCRLADVLTGISDNKLLELEKTQLDYTSRFKGGTNSIIEGLSVMENCFMSIVERESNMWDLTLEPFIEQLLFLDEMELSDKLIQDEEFIVNDGIIKVYLFLSNLINPELREISESSSSTDLHLNVQNKKGSLISEANNWAGILKGSIILKEKKVFEKLEQEKNEDITSDENNYRENNKEDNSESILSLSDSDMEIKEVADLDYDDNPDEETLIIHPRARNIFHGVYNKYAPLTTGLVENDLKISPTLNFNYIGGFNSRKTVGFSINLGSSESIIAHNKLEGSGCIWTNIISASVNKHIPVAAFLRIIYVCLKSNTSLKLKKYARNAISKPFVLDGIARLVLSCGLLESHVAAKFLFILSDLFELETDLNAESMDKLILIYIGFWFIHSILDSIIYVLQQATRRHLQPCEQLLCTSFSKAIFTMIELLGNIQFSKIDSIQKYGLDKTIRFFFDPLLLGSLQQMILFDIQLSIGSSHGTYMAHIPLMFSRKYILKKKDEMPETVIRLRETMRQYSSKSLSLLMEKSSKFRYHVVEGFNFHSIFHHFPLRRSFMFELLDHVNTLHFSRGIELFLSFYFNRNERIIGIYPCYIFIQTKDLRDHNKNNLNNFRKANDNIKDSAFNINLNILNKDSSVSNEDHSPPSKRSVLVLTTYSYYVFERPNTIRNVISSEQYKYKEDPKAIIKREYSDLKRIVKSFLGDQLLMLGWNSDEKGFRRMEQTTFTWRSTIYDIIIFDKIEDRDHMINSIRKKVLEVSAISLNIYNDFVSRYCLGNLLRLDNIRAHQFALTEKLKNGEVDIKIDKLYSLKPEEVKKNRFILEDMLDSVLDSIFPPSKKSRFPESAYTRAAILHDVEKSDLRLFVVTTNCIYEFQVDWRYWFCPDSNMLDTSEDLYFRREMVISPELEISNLKQTQTQVKDEEKGISKLGLMNFLGILDQIPPKNVNTSNSQIEILSQFNTENEKSLDIENKDKKDNSKDNGSKKQKAKNKVPENLKHESNIGISLRNFRSEYATWYETRLCQARDNLFRKVRVFRIHRLRVAQFGPLEEAELKLVYQLKPKVKKKDKSKEIEEKSESKGHKQTSSDEDPMLESSDSEDVNDKKDENFKEKKKMARLTSLQIIFLDDSARERFKVGVAIVINELDNSDNWKRRMVPVLNPPNLNKNANKEESKNKKISFF